MDRSQRVVELAVVAGADRLPRHVGGRCGRHRDEPHGGNGRGDRLLGSVAPPGAGDLATVCWGTGCGLRPDDLVDCLRPGGRRGSGLGGQQGVLADRLRGLGSRWGHGIPRPTTPVAFGSVAGDVLIRVGSQLPATLDDAPTRPSSGPIGWSGILATAMLELLLAWRSRGFWAVPVVLRAPALLVLVPDGLDGHFLRYASDQLRQFVAFTALLMPLLVLPTLFRTRGTEGDLTFATTHDGSAHALGTLLGLFGWLVPTVLAHLGARWLLGEVVSGQANWTLLTVGPVLALA